MLVFMVPIFFVGRVLGLFQQAANVSLAVLAIGAGLALIAAAITMIWGGSVGNSHP